MIECYPVIDCAFKYSGWRDTFCCRPPYFDKDAIEPVVDTLRTIMQSNQFKSGVEFVYATKDFTFVGVLKWVDELPGCEQYAYDKVERRLPAVVGISYQNSEKYYYPSLNMLSQLYRVFASDKYDILSEKNLDCYISGRLELNLPYIEPSRQKVIWKKTEYGIQIKSRGYGFLFEDKLHDYVNDEMFYFNNLPKGIELSFPHLLFSRKSIWSSNTNLIRFTTESLEDSKNKNLTFLIDSGLICNRDESISVSNICPDTNDSYENKEMISLKISFPEGSSESGGQRLSETSDSIDQLDNREESEMNSGTHKGE